LMLYAFRIFKIDSRHRFIGYGSLQWTTSPAIVTNPKNVPWFTGQILFFHTQEAKPSCPQASDTQQSSLQSGRHKSLAPAQISFSGRNCSTTCSAARPRRSIQKKLLLAW